MAARNREKNLISRSDIQEELYLLPESYTDYITKSGKVYKQYTPDKFYLKKHFINKHNGYVYINITCKDGKNRSRRLHILLGKMFIDNPNPKIFNVVGHKDNNKQNFDLNNLYWTTTQDNTQKAVDDGLNNQPKAEFNENSYPIKVIDAKTKKIVGVYGSLRECDRCVDNISIGMIAKMSSKKNYKLRSRKFIYQRISDEEFNQYSDLKNVHLIENPPVDKSPKIFRMINRDKQYEEIFDNQTAASKICGVPQATISRMLKIGDTSPIHGWSFEKIGQTTYAQSSAYDNFIKTVKTYVVQNIHTNEIRQFNSAEELKTEFGLNGHDINHYIRTGHTLLSEWKIIEVLDKD